MLATIILKIHRFSVIEARENWLFRSSPKVSIICWIVHKVPQNILTGNWAVRFQGVVSHGTFGQGIVVLFESTIQGNEPMYSAHDPWPLEAFLWQSDLQVFWNSVIRYIFGNEIYNRGLLFLHSYCCNCSGLSFLHLYYCNHTFYFYVL